VDKEGNGVVIIEDTMTTGGSIIKAIDALKEEGLKVIKAFVVVDRLEGGAQNVLAATSVEVQHLFTPEDFK
jgi:orotate phosphoribosyltransferase